MRYWNKVDGWIALILILVPLIPIPFLFIVPSDLQYVSWIITGVIGVILWPFFYGYVELRKESIYIRLGIFRKIILYKNIESIHKVKNLWSSYALTSDRIELTIHTDKKWSEKIYIGTKNRDLVYEALLQKCSIFVKDSLE